MSRQTLIAEIGEWLIDQALDQPDIVDLFEQLCVRLFSVGIPISRARLTWPTLHPLFQAETILWKRDQEIEFEQFRHQDEASDEWNRSPMKFIYENELSEFRRNLDGPNKMVDYPILEDLVEQGMTDYLIIVSDFNSNVRLSATNSKGVLVTWSCDRPGGFSDDDVAALKKIQRRFATACKAAIQGRIAKTITETYLGRHAGEQVLDGAIKLGDGQPVQAVVWYCDMRNSTALADTMKPDDLLDLLNDYFEATAGSAIEFGGEVLDFIGDAVLAIFPFENEEDKVQAIRLGTMALEKSIEVAARTNEARASQGKVGFDYGVGITIGDVMFGNIGVASRLAFTVIGPVVNEVERIETLTKAIEANALVTKEVAEVEPDNWQLAGTFQLSGVAQPRDLYSLAEVQPDMTDAAKRSEASASELTATPSK